MPVTVAGVFLIPLGLYWLFFLPRMLLPATVFCVILQGAAVINLNSPATYALSPYYFFALLVVLNQVLRPVRPSEIWFPLGHWLYVLLGFTAIMAVVLPIAFEGLPVYNPRNGVDEQYNNLTPLSFGFGNVSQVAYLCLNIFVLRAFFCLGNTDERRMVGKAFNYSVALLVVVGLYQLTHFWLGWYFPFDLIYSNQIIREAQKEDLIGYTRMFSTFPEPSYFSAYLVGYFFYRYLSFGTQADSRFKEIAVILVIVSCIALSGSTTGYVTLIVLGSATLLFINPSKNIGKKLAVVSIAVVMIGGFVITPFGQSMIASTLLDKGDTLSAIHRLAADMRAAEIVVETAGLGVGLGSNRSSSLLTSTLSSLGIIGFCILVLCFIKFWLFSFRRAKGKSPAKSLANALRWAWVAIILSLIVGIPDINWPVLWIFWGISVVPLLSRQRGLTEARSNDSIQIRTEAV